MCVCLCCVSKSINTNPAVASQCFHMSQPSCFRFGCQRNLICQAILPRPPRYTILSFLLLILSLLQAPPPPARLQCTFSPVFIRLLAENSFRERVTSLQATEMRKGEREHLQTGNITGKPEFEAENVSFYSLRDFSNMFVP